MANEKIVNRENLKAFRQELDKRYAKPDGYYPTMTVGLADNLTPFSEDSGAEQDNPFISNGTGTNNNTEIVTVGDYGLLQEKQGNTLVVNQLVQNGNFVDASSWGGVGCSISVSNGEATITDNATSRTFTFRTDTYMSFPNGKYLVAFQIKGVNITDIDYIRVTTPVNSNVISSLNGLNTSNYISFFDILDVSSSTATRLSIQVRKTSETLTSTSVKIKNVQLINLTQMFNGNIPQDLLDNPSHFSWYYNGSLAYNTGTLVNANGVKLVSTGRNLFAGNSEDNTQFIGNYEIDSADGFKLVSIGTRNCFRIRVNPNADFSIFTTSTTLSSASIVRFVDKDYNLISGNAAGFYAQSIIKTTPANCAYIEISLAKAYVGNICITPYYTPEQGGEGYSNYYPYEPPYEVDTGSEVLRSAGSVKDYKEPNGTIHRVVGYVDLGTLEWEYEGNRFRSVEVVAKETASTSIIANALCPKYTIASSDTYLNSDKQLAIATSGKILIRDTSYTNAATFKTAMNGVILYFELATPTTEQGTPFAENLPINDYGMLYWLDENDELVAIPQGAKIFYPTNYKGFVDDMYSRVDGDSSAYVIQSELAQYVKQVDLSSGITDVAGLTYNIKKAYKIGNLCVVSIRATNSTGSAIAPSTTLFTVPSSMGIGSTYMVSYGGLSIGGETKVVIYSSNIYLEKELKSTESLTFTITYLI